MKLNQKRFLAMLLLVLPGIAFAAGSGPFGTGLPDSGGFSVAGRFPELFALLVRLQAAFNQSLTTSIENLNHHGTGLPYLLVIAFLYGVVHAVGPGHGKAVTTSYLLASRQTLRNGILLAFLAAIVQALSAITLITIASLVLHATSVSITKTSYRLELASDCIIIGLGLYLVWSRLLQPSRTVAMPFAAPTPVMAQMAVAARAPVSQRFQASPIHAASLDDCDCGDLHIPDARFAAGTLDFKKAWGVIATTALRPCTGALIVLVFSLSQGVFWAGILATFIMSLGTALSVCTLAALTVTARSSLSFLGGANSRVATTLMRVVEILASLSVLALGIGLLVFNLGV